MRLEKHNLLRDSQNVMCWISSWSGKHYFKTSQLFKTQQLYQYNEVLLSVVKFQKCFRNFHIITCRNILQFSDQSVHFQIVKSKLEQVFRKTFWNITKGSNNNGDDSKLKIAIHYLRVSDKWCVIDQPFINLSRNVYVCGAVYFNDCANFFLLSPNIFFSLYPQISGLLCGTFVTVCIGIFHQYSVLFIL